MEREMLKKALLEQHMRHSRLHPHPCVVVKNFVKGRDILVSLPTGSGKSFCYYCLPMVFGGPRIQPQDASHVVVVVSPLTAFRKSESIESEECLCYLCWKGGKSQ